MGARGFSEPTGWRDALTGLEGPDAWQQALVAEVARAARYGRPMTAIVLEVEGVSELDRIVGEELSKGPAEAAASKALRQAADALRRESRTSDLVFRIGQARFGVILTETDEVTAVNYVERVREAMPPRLPGRGEGVRLSFGWASPLAGESADVLVRRADLRLTEERLR